MDKYDWFMRGAMVLMAAVCVGSVISKITTGHFWFVGWWYR